MPEETTLIKYIHDKLREGNWPGIEMDEETKILTCPKGEVLKFASGNYHLKIFSYSSQRREFFERDRYKEIIFPESFDIKKVLYFRNNGNYLISREPQFKKIINPLNKKVEIIKITTGTRTRRFYGTTLTISQDIFWDTLKDANSIYKRKNSYASSIEN